MPKTLAQKAADKALEDAVTRAIEAYNLLPSGHTLIDYVVAIEGGALVLDEAEAGAGYDESLGLAFRHGHCRSSTARGLLQMGSDALRQGTWVNSEDGEEA